MYTESEWKLASAAREKETEKKPLPPTERKGVKRLIYRRRQSCAKSKYVSLLSLLTLRFRSLALNK